MLVHEINVLWAPTHPPSLNFCSSSSKAKPKAVQEMTTKCRPMFKLTKWINVAIPCGPYLPLGAFVEFFSPRLGWLKGTTFHPCLSYLASFWNQSERIWYYGSSTLGTRALFLVCGSSPRLNKCSFSSYPLKAKYMEPMGKEKRYNSSYVYFQAKGWSKKS